MGENSAIDSPVHIHAVGTANYLKGHGSETWWTCHLKSGTWFEHLLWL